MIIAEKAVFGTIYAQYKSDRVVETSECGHLCCTDFLYLEVRDRFLKKQKALLKTLEDIFSTPVCNSQHRAKISFHAHNVVQHSSRWDRPTVSKNWRHRTHRCDTNNSFGQAQGDDPNAHQTLTRPMIPCIFILIPTSRPNTKSPHSNVRLQFEDMVKRACKAYLACTVGSRCKTPSQ